jgi:hypothetical protein
VEVELPANATPQELRQKIHDTFELVKQSVEDEINAQASAGIPWDAIVVIIIGALVLGLGVGFLIFLNFPV